MKSEAHTATQIVWELCFKCSSCYTKRKLIIVLTVLALSGLLVSWCHIHRVKSTTRIPRVWFSRYPSIALAGNEVSSGSISAHLLPATTATKSTTAKPRIPLTPAGVPKVIHFIYRASDVIEPYREALRSCVTQNPDWRVVLWTDAAIQAFMQRHFPHQIKVFAAFPHKIQRSDAIRYLIMYKFGGLYMDLDMTCHGTLLPSLAPYSCFLDCERRHQTQFIHNRPYSAMNSAMGCTPAHPFFFKVMDFVFRPERTRGPFSFPHTIFVTTGPMMLTQLYDEWNKNTSNPTVVMLNETYFSPKINPRSGVYGNCRRIAQGLKNRAGGLSASERVCLELQQLGFENSDRLFITNRTVAIHQFTHLGYHNQNSRTFNVHKEFPRVMTYEQLEADSSS